MSGKKTLFFSIVFLLAGLFASVPVKAMTVTLLTDINLSQQTVDKGATVANADKSLSAIIAPAVFKKPTTLSIRQHDRGLFEFPDGWTAVSDVFEFQFGSAPAVGKIKTLKIRLIAIENNNRAKKLFVWSDKEGAWIEQSAVSVGVGKLQATINRKYGKIVMLESDETMTVGHASWYKYKNCDCAASPDYPKGTKLKVTNLDNGKSLVVKINDWGPERDKFPSRVIDLDKVAFSQLGSLHHGILENVKVEEVD